MFRVKILVSLGYRGYIVGVACLWLPACGKSRITQNADLHASATFYRDVDGVYIEGCEGGYQIPVPSLNLAQIPVPRLIFAEIPVTKSKIPLLMIICKIMHIIN